MAANKSGSKLVFDDDGQAREVRALEQLLFGDEGQAAATVLGAAGAAAAAEPSSARPRRRPRGGGGGGDAPTAATAAPSSASKKNKRNNASSDASALAALVARAEEADDDELFAVDRPAGSDGDDDGDDGEDDDDGGMEAAAAAAASTKQQQGDKRERAAERARRRQAREQAASVWHDPDDEGLTIDVSAASKRKGAARLRKLRSDEAQATMTGGEYERALRARHAALAGARGSRWAAAALRRADEEEEAEEEAARREGSAVWSGDDGGEDGEGGGEGGEGGGEGGGKGRGGNSDGARTVADLLRRGNGLATASSSRRGAAAAKLRSSANPSSTNASAAQPLPPGSLHVARLRDANAAAPSAAVVRSVEWHPNGQLLMTAGMDRSVRLFGVDGRHNPLVQGVHLADTPVQRAAFAGVDGGVVVAAGRRSYYYVIDLHTGAAERVVAPPAVFAAHGRGRGDPGLTALVRAGAASRGGGGGAAAKRRAASMAAGAAASAAGGPRLKSLETFAVTPPSAYAASLGHHQPFLNEPLAAFAGDGGHVAIVSLRTRQPVAGAAATLKVASGGAGAVRCLSFAGPDSRQLLASAGDGLVYVWDLRKSGGGGSSGGSSGSNTPLAVFRDEGCVAPSALAASRDGRWLACGSSSGVVNVYRTQPGMGCVPFGGGGSMAADEAGGLFAGGGFSGGPSSFTAAPLFGSAVASPSPARALMNLVTSADTLAFSPDSQALLAASRLKRDALRVWQLPTLTAFGNWPTGQTPLHYVHSCAFSPGGGMLAVGNAKGRALLYRLLHYGRV